MVKVEAKTVNRLDNEESTYKGTVRVVLGEELSTSVMVVQGKNGLFISFPSYYSNKEGKYKDIIYPVTKEAREAIEGTVLKAFSDESGRAVSEGEKGIGVTKAYATYVADNKKAGIGTLVFGDCLKVNGVNIYEKKERPGDYFVSLPSRKGEKDGKEKYYDYVYPLSTKLRGEIDVKLIQSLEESRKKSEEKGLNEEISQEEKGQNEDIGQEEQEKEMQRTQEEQQKRKGR